jgi:O-antigen/teichoic acid export membrane protein
LPDAQSDRFVRSSLALVSSNGAGAVLGVAFWAVAARMYPARLVGYGAAEIAAMTFVGSIALFNLGTVFPRFLYPAGARAGTVLRAGYTASVTIALISGIVFLTLTGHHSFLQVGLPSALAFLGAVVLWVIFTIEDAALIGLRATIWVPVENTSFSVGKILLLPVFAAVAPRSGVFNSWILPVIVCVVVVNIYLFRRVLPAHVTRSAGRGVLPDRRVLRSVVLGEYLGGLSFMAMTSLPAIIVVSQLGPRQAAYFQTPWLAGTSFDLLLFSFATSLIVEASVRPASASATVRRAVRLAPLFLIPGMVILVVGAPYFLRILGPAYAANGTQLLRLVALTLPFMAVNVLYITYARLARRVRRVLTIQVSMATIVLTLTALFLGHFGITGVGLAFLIGHGVVSLFVFPSVLMQYRRPDMAPSYAPSATLVATRTHGPT